MVTTSEVQACTAWTCCNPGSGTWVCWGVIALLQRYKHSNESTGRTVQINNLWKQNKQGLRSRPGEGGLDDGRDVLPRVYWEHNKQAMRSRPGEGGLDAGRDVLHGVLIPVPLGFELGDIHQEVQVLPVDAVLLHRVDHLRNPCTCRQDPGTRNQMSRDVVLLHQVDHLRNPCTFTEDLDTPDQTPKDAVLLHRVDHLRNPCTFTEYLDTPNKMPVDAVLLHRVDHLRKPCTRRASLVDTMETRYSDLLRRTS